MDDIEDPLGYLFHERWDFAHGSFWTQTTAFVCVQSGTRHDSGGDVETALHLLKQRAKQGAELRRRA